MPIGQVIKEMWKKRSVEVGRRDGGGRVTE